MTKACALYASTLILALSVVTLSRISVAAEPEAAAPKECCITRDNARQICRVTPGEGETCASILSYLNTAGTVGKSYCGGSKLRGGWKAVDCATPQPTP